MVGAKLSKKVIFLVLVPIAIDLLFLTWLSAVYMQLEHNLRDEVQARKTVSILNEYQNSMMKGVDALGIFLQSRSEESVDTYHESVATCKSTFAKLRKLLGSESSKKKDLDDIEYLMGQVAIRAEKLVTSADTDDGVTRAMRAASAKSVSDQLVQSLNSLGASVQTDLDKNVQAAENQRDLVRVALMVGVLVNIIMAPAAVILLSTQLAKRLSILIDTSKRIAAGDKLPAPLPGDDEMTQLDKTLRTMSAELNQMMRRQRAILDNTSEIICTISERRNFDIVNPAVEAVIGRSPEELSGKRFLSIVLPEDAEATTKALDKAENGQPQTFENRLLKADGSRTHMLWAVRFVEEERSFFCVAHDISERKELEELKQKIVSIVSHDLRSPLMSLQIKMESLAEGERGPLPEPVVSDLRRAEKNIDRMITLTNDLLDLQKLRAGNWVMRFRDRSLLSILNESVQSIQALAESRDTRIHLPDKDIIFTADGERIGQVVSNFLINAVKFSPPGRPVEIQAKSGDGLLEVSIVDHGPGISAADQKIIFERFQQGDQHGAQTKGSGLGLSICKEIVEAHGGTVGVVSQPGNGSTFWFRVPLKQASSHAVV